jgi:hypothetical protein
MTRYTLAGPYKAEHDAQGEWVLWRDVREALTTCGELAAQRDRYYAALTKIAAIPLTLPNAAAGVQAAKDALDER